MTFFVYLIFGALLAWPLRQLWQKLGRLWQRRRPLHYLLPYAPPERRSAPTTAPAHQP